MHELDPAWDPPPPDADRYKQPDQIIARLTGLEGPVARLAPASSPVRSGGSRCESTTSSGRSQSSSRCSLLTRPSVGVLTVAELLGETPPVSGSATRRTPPATR